MKNTSASRTVLAGFALSGLLSGLATQVHGSASGGLAMSAPGINPGLLADDGGGIGKHSCKGKNACKGQGGCMSGNNGCKGKNDCKGKGGCASGGAA